MKHPYWHYFVALSEDLERTIRFVELVEDNFKTYSIEFVRLYLAIGSEIDVVAKLLCKQSDASKSAKDINDYRSVILAKHPNLPKTEVIVPRSELSLTPWKDWGKGTNPPWWKHYNRVKHQRDEAFKEANLENTLNALAGLYVVVGYLYAEDLRDNQLPGLQNFIRFSPEYNSGHSIGAGGLNIGFRLPGIPMSEQVLKMREKYGIQT